MRNSDTQLGVPRSRVRSALNDLVSAGRADVEGSGQHQRFDGLHEYLADDDELRELLRFDVRNAASAAIRHANARGGKDNITALFVELVAG